MYEKRKGKLSLKTWAVISVVFYVAAFCFEWMQEPLDFLIGIVLSVIAAGIFLYVGILAMTPLLNNRVDEITTLTRLRTELNFIEKGLLPNETKKPEKKNGVRICLSDAAEAPKPTGSYNVYGSDMKLEPKDKR